MVNINDILTLLSGITALASIVVSVFTYIKHSECSAGNCVLDTNAQTPKSDGTISV